MVYASGFFSLYYPLRGFIAYRSRICRRLLPVRRSTSFSIWRNIQQFIASAKRLLFVAFFFIKLKLKIQFRNPNSICIRIGLLNAVAGFRFKVGAYFILHCWAAAVSGSGTAVALYWSCLFGLAAWTLRWNFRLRLPNAVRPLSEVATTLQLFTKKLEYTSI
jgi:hypothetical protein